MGTEGLETSDAELIGDNERSNSDLSDYKECKVFLLIKGKFEKSLIFMFEMHQKT